MILVWARTVVTSQISELYEDSARRCAQKSRSEPGNLTYHYSRDLLNPDVVHTFEIWESKHQLAAHRAAPHRAARVRELADLGIDDVQVVEYEVLRAREAGPSHQRPNRRRRL